MIRIVLADDHALVRRGLRQVLTALPDVEVVAEVGNASEVFDAAQSSEADVLLLDVGMPGIRFLDLLQTLRAGLPRLRVLVVSGYAESAYARSAIRAGAAGYVSKARADEELLVAVRTVANGQRFITPQLANELADDLASGRGGEPHADLSDREREVMLLLVAGHTVTDIADQLGVSVKTISTHRTRLLAKMGVTTNAELVRYARSHGLLP